MDRANSDDVATGRVSISTVAPPESCSPNERRHSFTNPASGSAGPREASGTVTAQHLACDGIRQVAQMAWAGAREAFRQIIAGNASNDRLADKLGRRYGINYDDGVRRAGKGLREQQVRGRICGRHESGQLGEG
jgi:hypothetical protein